MNTRITDVTIQFSDSLHSAAWFIAILCALLVALITAFIICCCQRQRTGKYAVKRKELEKGHHIDSEEHQFVSRWLWKLHKEATFIALSRYQNSFVHPAIIFWNSGTRGKGRFNEVKKDLTLKKTKYRMYWKNAMLQICNICKLLCKK